MKRDMDLVREILRSLETREGRLEVEVPGRSREEMFHHLRIMEDAGLVHGVKFTSAHCLCDRLTWEGHDFLEQSRNDTIWQRAKSLAMEKTGGLAFAVLTEALKTVTKMAIAG